MVAAPRLAESDRVQPQEQRADGDQQPKHEGKREQRLPGEGRADHQELAHEDAERRQAGDGNDAEHQPPAEHGIVLVRPPMSAIFCVPLT